MSNSVSPPTSTPDEVGLEARDQALLAEDQRHPLGAAALERLAVARADERDDRVVAVPGAAVLDRGERRVLVAQLLEDLVDPGVVDRVDLRAEVEVPVVAELDLGPDLDRRLEDERLALLGLDDLDVGVGQRQEVLLDERLAVRLLDEVVDGVVEDGARAEMRSSTGRGALPGRKPGTRVRRERWRTASSTARSSRSAGSSISSTTVDLGAGVAVICIAREV